MLGTTAESVKSAVWSTFSNKPSDPARELEEQMQQARLNSIQSSNGSDGSASPKGTLSGLGRDDDQKRGSSGSGKLLVTFGP
jgi:hypothetical protein